ncbi:RNA helicase Mov10l1-like [Homarus americanus]|uniref:RNA helicase Mov10l1-like n=1 Tax=Homarus americanus TaxID=6706 RepID=UPI001C47AC88|nr:RNA helicase Mov10l1-like [Homarus americanus]
MITMVQKAVGYFIRGTDDNSSKFGEPDRPRLEDFIPVSLSKVETCNFYGVITSVNGSCIIISDHICCDASEFQFKRKLSLNDKVRGEARRASEYEAWQVVKIQLVQEEWDADGEDKLDYQKSDEKVNKLGDAFVKTFPSSSFKNGAIPCRDLEAGIPGILKQDLLSSLMKTSQPKEPQEPSSSSEDMTDKLEVQQTLIGRVTSIVADTVTLNEDISFNLSAADCTWEILQGDWIICEVDCVSSIQTGSGTDLKGFIQMSSCKPLRKKRVRGEVTHLYSTYFVVNQEIYCTRGVAKTAIVRVGDTVTVEVIESHQHEFCWRAIALTFGFLSATTQELRTTTITRLLLDLPKCGVSVRGSKTKNILENKQNIVISESLRFPTVALGSQSYISAFIKNTGSEARILKQVYFVSASQECQFNVNCCSSGGIIDGTPVTIDPDMGVSVRFECTGKLLGLVKQLCIFDFGHFQIGRYVSATIEDKSMTCLAPVTPYTPHQWTRNPSHLQLKDREIIKGEKPFKSPAFLPTSLPMACIPQHLWQTLESGRDILSVAPSLSEPLTPENHKEKLSVFLHLEEIELTLQMRQFDIMRTSFSQHGAYLSLTVPGLMEKRPSLMIGDTVIASNPFDSNDVEYEGNIHEVLHTQILLKFHPTFHNEHCGKDYRVRFNFNRTPLRRCHFALDFAMKQLGPDILFPSKVKIQLPQVCYVDPEVPTLACKGRKAPDRVMDLNFSPGTDSTVALPMKQIPESMNRTNKSIVRHESLTRVFYSDMKSNKNEKTKYEVKENLECVSHEQVNCDGGVFGDAFEANRQKCSDQEKNCLKENPQTMVKYQLKELDHFQIKENNGAHKISTKMRNLGMDNGRNKMMAKCHNQELCLTPPRIPVVTRLFGVPSSGSSSNSSMCCSDDESRGSVVQDDNVSKFRRVERRKLGANKIPDTCDMKNWTKRELKNEGSIKNSEPKFCISSADAPLVTAFPPAKEITEINKGEHSHNSGHAPLRKQLHGKERQNIPVKIEVQTVRSTNSELSKSSGTNVRLTETGDKKKILFLPRSLELSFYQNAKNNKGRGDDNLLCISTKEESVRTQEEQKSDIDNNTSDIVDCSGCSDNINLHQQPLKSHRIEKKLVECKNFYRNTPNNHHFSNSRKEPQNNKDFTVNHKSDEGRNAYIVPVLPVHPLRKKGLENLAHLPVLKWFNENLNLEQKLAVRRVLDGTTRPLPYVIFGPPGTGKTVTLVETTLQILTMIQYSRILIITPSNSASDLVVERLLTFGELKKVDLVRLNAYQRLEDSVPEIIRPYCCNGDELSIRVHQRIIVTTATSSGVLYTIGLHNGHFSHVLVDEAGQLTEPECLVALGLVNRESGQLVLAGDPQQLGPVVQSSLAKKYGFQRSLLQRLCNSVLYQPQEVENSSSWVYQPFLVTQLVKNYRSHPDILTVPSSLFYHNSLQACVDTKIKDKLLSWDELPCHTCPLLFHGVVGENLQEGDSPSWFNAAEAFQVVRYTKSLILFGVKSQDIGIITPYRKQVEKIRKLITTFGIAENVKVGSVEEFQGQERSVIIISTVRSSSDLMEVDVRHSLGFVKCPKRFNVTVTRAQALLVVVGNPLLLSLDNCWRELIKFCLQKGAYRGPELHVLVNEDKE